MGSPDRSFSFQYENETEAFDIGNNVMRFVSRSSFVGMVWTDSGPLTTPMMDVPVEEAYGRMTPPMSMRPVYDANDGIWETTLANDAGFRSLGTTWDNDSLPNDVSPNLELDHYHPSTASYGIVSLEETVPSPLDTARFRFICQHHPPDQQGSCGQLVDGNANDALDHFATVHIYPVGTDSDSDRWTCHWRGRCGIRVRKENARRHIAKHLFRWKCLNCLSIYSRDDTIRKHAKGCGNGYMNAMVIPRKWCTRLWRGTGG